MNQSRGVEQLKMLELCTWEGLRQLKPPVLPILAFCALFGALVVYSVQKNQQSGVESEVEESEQGQSGSFEQTVKARRRKGMRLSSGRLEQVIRMEALAELARTSSVLLRGSAVKILIAHATTAATLRFFLEEVRQSTDGEARYKAITALQQVAKHEEYRLRLIEAGLPQICCQLLLEESNEASIKEALLTLYELTASDNELKSQLVAEAQLLECLKKTLMSCSNRELLNWTLLFVHNLALVEALQPQLVANGYVLLIGTALRHSFGNWTLQKLCFNALVRLLASLEIAQAREQLLTLEPINIVGLISSALRQDDTESIYWALGLLHDYVIRDVMREKFRKCSVLVRALLHLISSRDPMLTNILLRIFKFMTLRASEFQIKMIEHGIVDKLLACLATGDEDCQYWALTSLHDITAHPQATQLMLKNSSLTTLLDLFNCDRPLVPLYVVDIVTCLCASQTANVDTILQTNIVLVVKKFLQSDDADVIAGGLSCVFNLAIMSTRLIKALTDAQCHEAVIPALLNVERPKLEIMCSKLVALFAVHDLDRLASWVCDDAIQQYVLKVFMEFSYKFQNTLKSVAEGVESGIEVTSLGQNQTPLTPESCLNEHQEAEDTKSPQNVSSPADPSDPITGETDISSSATKALLAQQAERLEGALQVLQVFSYYPQIMKEFFIRHGDILEILVDSLCQLMMLPLTDKHFELRPLCSPALQSSSNANSNRELKNSVAASAVDVLAFLYQYDQPRVYLDKVKLIEVLLACLRTEEALAENVLIALARCAQSVPARYLWQKPGLVASVWYHHLLNHSATCRFWSKIVLDTIACEGTSSGQLRQNKFVSSSRLLVSHDGREVWNDTWAFESIRSQCAVTSGQKAMYGVEILTDGLVQLGWATSTCIPDVSCGRGIGDDDGSYAYDGMRKKKWHGLTPHFEGTDYGETWKAGDIITCLLDLAAGKIAYLHNGKDLGIAFQDVDCTMLWYPAISMSSKQGVRIQFGGDMDPISYSHRGYTSMHQLGKARALYTSPMPLVDTEIDGSALSSPSSSSSSSRLSFEHLTLPLHKVHEEFVTSVRLSDDLYQGSSMITASLPQLIPNIDPTPRKLTLIFEVITSQDATASQYMLIGLRNVYGDLLELRQSRGDSTVCAIFRSKSTSVEAQNTIVRTDIQSIDWHSGTAIGMGLLRNVDVNHRNMDYMFFCHDGKVICMFEIDPEWSLHIPYMRGFVEHHVNFGATPISCLASVPIDAKELVNI